MPKVLPNILYEAFPIVGENRGRDVTHSYDGGPGISADKSAVQTLVKEVFINAQYSLQCSSIESYYKQRCLTKQ